MQIADRHIISGFGITLVFLMFAKLIAAAKEMMIAHSFGTTAAVDAYALGLAVAQAPITLVAMSVNMILIPLFVADSQDPQNRSDHSRVMLGATVIGFVMSAGVFTVLRWGGGLLQLDPQIAQTVARQAGGFALMVPSGVVASILAARLMAGRRHINSLCEAVPSAVLIAGLIMFEGRIAADMLLAWFSCLGMVGYLGVLILCDRQNALPIRATGKLARLSWRDIAMIVTAQTVFVASGVVLDQMVAASLPAAENAALSYANRLLILATALGATAIGRSVLPVLAAARQHDDNAAISLTRRWAFVLCAMGSVLCLLAQWAAPYAVAALYERGAFGADDTAAVTAILRVNLLMLPLYFPSLILSQSAVVQRRYGLFLTSNLSAAFSKAVLLYVFLADWGLAAILWGTLLRQAVSLAFTLPALRPRRRIL